MWNFYNRRWSLLLFGTALKIWWRHASVLTEIKLRSVLTPHRWCVERSVHVVTACNLSPCGINHSLLHHLPCYQDDGGLRAQWPPRQGPGAVGGSNLFLEVIVCGQMVIKPPWIFSTQDAGTFRTSWVTNHLFPVSVDKGLSLEIEMKVSRSNGEQPLDVLHRIFSTGLMKGFLFSTLCLLIMGLAAVNSSG